MTHAATTSKSSATVANSAVCLDGFVERDQEVVNLVSASDDAESAVHRCMQTGARALGLAQTSLDTAVVERAFDGMSRDFDGKLGETVEEINKKTTALLGEEDGELAHALGAWREDVSNLLGETFDPDSKRSVIAKLEAVLGQALDQHVEAVRQVVDPDREDSPLGRQKAAILKTVDAGQENVLKAIQEVSEKIAVQKVQVELIEKTAAKGFSFEELAHEKVSAIAGAQGDIAEQVGRVSGSDGSQVGDEVVTLDPEVTRGQAGRYVLELKDRKLGQKATFEELDKAMANREAAAGIAVFSSAENAPIGTAFQFWGHKAIVVFDKESGDVGALKLACFWARWIVRRQLDDDGSQISLEKIQGLIDDARRALDRLTTIRRYHTTAQKKIGEASDQLTDLAGDVETALDALAAEIRG